MKMENLVVIAVDKSDLEPIDFKSIEKKLYSFKEQIHHLKIGIQSYSENNKAFFKEVNDLILATATIQEQPYFQSNTFVKIRGHNNVLTQTENTIQEIRNFLISARMEEGKIRQDIFKKDQVIKEYKMLNERLLSEILEYERNVKDQKQKTDFLEKTLQRRKKLMESRLIEAEYREKKLIKKFNDKLFELSKKVKIYEQTIAQYESKDASILMRLEDESIGFSVIDDKLINLLDIINRKHILKRELESEYKNLRQKCIDNKTAMTNIEELNIINVKKGSWIQLVWNWWHNESQTRYLEKAEELNNTIKEFHQTINSYEIMLEKMNSYFYNYEENDENITKEINEIKEQINTFVQSKSNYVDKMEKLESELMKLNEKSLEKINELEKKVVHLEQQNEEYKASLEHIQKELTQYQERYENRKKTNNSLSNKGEIQPNTLTSFLAQKKNNQPKQSNEAVQKIQNKLELIKKYYPQTQTRSTVFNPFKK